MGPKVKNGPRLLTYGGGVEGGKVLSRPGVRRDGARLRTSTVMERFECRQQFSVKLLC